MTLGWRRFGSVALEPPPNASAAAFMIRARDGFADPPALIVRDEAMAAVGEPEPVRAGALADLVARLDAAGHEVAVIERPAPPRRPTPLALHREGSGRFWLWRRHPARHPLPRPAEVGLLRLPLLALGALHANGRPTKPG